MTRKITVHYKVAPYFVTCILVMKCHPLLFVLFQDGGQRKPCYVTKIHLRFESCAGILARLLGGTHPQIILYESQYPLRVMVEIICIQTDQEFSYRTSTILQ